MTSKMAPHMQSVKAINASTQLRLHDRKPARQLRKAEKSLRDSRLRSVRFSIH
jgi:hypothetical protein